MTRDQFLQRIYATIKPGMSVQKPNKTSKILRVTENGSIYYLIGTTNQKAVTKDDLIAIYNALVTGTLTNKKITEISGSSRPCNVTTIKWLLKKLDLACEGQDRTWSRTW